MQRTGGTSLTELLMEMSEHRAAEHEPFNWAKKRPRQFWPITDAWLKTRDEAVLRESLEKIFSERYLIKHCYEILQMPFNETLMRVSAVTPYRHILLLRRDEASRLISKFIAQAQGTWFPDYARKVFAEVASGTRTLQPLPVDQVVEQFRHCRDATKIISETLGTLKVNLLPIFYEDLYAGPREERLTNLHNLLDFIGFTKAEQQEHHDLIENKIFERGQNTPTVAPYVPNLQEVMRALGAAGCKTEDVSVPTDDGKPSRLQGARSGPPNRVAGRSATPVDRLAQECVASATSHAASGPYLEISTYAPERAILGHPHFAGTERDFISAKAGIAPNGISARVGNPNDMRAIFEDGRFGTIFWTNALGEDRFFWRTLDEIKRVLAPGGMLIVTAPSFGRGASQIGINITGAKGNTIADATLTQRVQSTHDYWRISPQTLRDVILEGFRVEDVKVIMMPPRVLGVGHKPVYSEQMLSDEEEFVDDACGDDKDRIDARGALDRAGEKA